MGISTDIRNRKLRDNNILIFYLKLRELILIKGNILEVIVKGIWSVIMHNEKYMHLSKLYGDDAQWIFFNFHYDGDYTSMICTIYTYNGEYSPSLNTADIP